MSFDKNILRRVLFWLLTVTLAVSAGVMAIEHLQGQMGHAVYEQALQVETQPQPLPQPAPVQEQGPEEIPSAEPERELPVVSEPQLADILHQVNLPALQQVNEEVLGWLYIPGTAVSYPLMRHKDNEFYLTHNWKKENYIDGAIYMDCRNSLAGTDFNTIIYGHNKEDGFMFSELVGYREQAFCDAHPYVYLYTPGGIFRYRVFSSHEVEDDGYVYQLKNLVPEDFLEESLSRSVVQTDGSVTPEDRVISLSTCTGYWTDTRFVVQAVLDAVVE